MRVLEQLREVVEDLADVRVADLGDEALQSFALAVEKAAQQLRGIASRALGEVHHRTPDGAAFWWRDELGLSGEAAGHAVRRARDLLAMPVVSEAVVAGSLSLDKAGALTPLVGKLDEDLLEESQPQLVEGARQRTVNGIAHWVREIIAINSEHDLDAEHDAAQARRMLSYRLEADGLVHGRFALTADAFETVAAVLEPLARKTDALDVRTAAQRRADALEEVFAGAARWADLPQAGGQRAQVSYVISAEWAAAQDWAPPATGAWMGPATRARVEAVLCDARLSRVLLDAEGQVQSLEAVNGDISRAQRRAVSARDGCCVARGCNRPPSFCDVHHLRSREDGGPTTLENLVLLCRRHHVMWHRGQLRLVDLRVPWLRKPLDPPMVA